MADKGFNVQDLFGINEYIKSSAQIVTFRTVFESLRCFLGKAYVLHKCSKNLYEIKK